jgi:hypothetical protein
MCTCGDYVALFATSAWHSRRQMLPSGGTGWGGRRRNVEDPAPEWPTAQAPSPPTDRVRRSRPSIRRSLSVSARDFEAKRTGSMIGGAGAAKPVRWRVRTQAVAHCPDPSSTEPCPPPRGPESLRLGGMLDGPRIPAGQMLPSDAWVQCGGKSGVRISDRPLPTRRRATNKPRSAPPPDQFSMGSSG